MSDLRKKAINAELEAARLALEYAQGVDDRHAMVRAMTRIRVAKRELAVLLHQVQCLLAEPAAG